MTGDDGTLCMLDEADVVCDAIQYFLFCAASRESCVPSVPQESQRLMQEHVGTTPNRVGFGSKSFTVVIVTPQR